MRTNMLPRRFNRYALQVKVKVYSSHIVFVFMI